MAKSTLFLLPVCLRFRNQFFPEKVYLLIIKVYSFLFFPPGTQITY